MDKKVSRRNVLGLLSAISGAALLEACSSVDMNPRDALVDDGALDKMLDASSKEMFDASQSQDAGEMLDAAQQCELSSSDAQGPFFRRGAPNQIKIADDNEAGERLNFHLRLVDESCVALAGWRIDLWQADVSGNYFDEKLRGFAQSDADGAVYFSTIMPGRYLQAAGYRPAHLHLKVTAPNGAERLVTQVYFKGDPFLGDEDSCPRPTCDSHDSSRILPLRMEQIEGRAVLRADARLVVTRE